LYQYHLDDPVLRLMARDYLAIPATTCIAERSFSMSARTDDPRRRTMKKLKFGALQKLRAGYLDGRISVGSEILNKYLGDFDFNENEYVE
jgi:hAT family C-terminal dimerisation region